MKTFLNAYEACKMKKIICMIASAMLILSTSGCATNSCGSGLFGTGLFASSAPQSGLFQPQPLSRNPLQSFTQGAPCDTCNAPAGQVYNGSGSTNVAPLCQDGSCYGGSPVSTQGNVQLNDPGVSYYDNGSGTTNGFGTAPSAAFPNSGNSVLPQGNFVPNNGQNLIQGSANRVPLSNNNQLRSFDAFSSAFDADSVPPLP